MPAEFVSAVKTHRVCAQQPFHPLHKICPWRLYDQMKMIAHQTIGVYLPPGLLTGSTQHLEETLTIHVIPKNLLPSIASAHQVIDSPFVLNSQLASHRQSLRQT